jgi:WD40 repeat protein
MADIFLSYASEDISRAKALVEILDRQGWSVFWNLKIRVGKQFDQILLEELREAKCVVVLWSRQSVQSDWVKGEAKIGKDRGILIPALIDKVDVPLFFQLTQTAKLYDWKGHSEHSELGRLLVSIGEVIHPSPKSHRETSSGTVTHPVRAIPVSQSETHRVRGQFKFFSPARRYYKTATAPREEEKWRLVRTLPSGLYLGIKPTKAEEVYDAFRYFLRLPEKRFQREGYDFRKFQYDVERHQREHPLLYVDDHWDTSSVSWHPTNNLLVTAGTGNQAKLWNVETGELITENPCWSSYSSGKSISWSDDAEVFAVDKYSFDGRTGELLADAPKEAHDWTYSSSEYEGLRGPSDYVSHGVSHVAATHNFTSFKPNSPHRVIKNKEKNLIFRHRLTGEIERVIDCDVPSAIRDFAWHPKGQFIAIAFEGHNVSIVDTDEVRTIDSLSAQHLVGWSPDGKTLVLRRGWKVTDDFVVWDALEMKEQPITEEIKNGLWFKRFFNNVSADGLRYVRIEGGQGKIYSLVSHELLATLPEPVTCAAWSPIDGGRLATCAGSKTHIWTI